VIAHVLRTGFNDLYSNYGHYERLAGDGSVNGIRTATAAAAMTANGGEVQAGQWVGPRLATGMREYYNNYLKYS
jgi:hypothetical protein